MSPFHERTAGRLILLASSQNKDLVCKPGRNKSHLVPLLHPPQADNNNCLNSSLLTHEGKEGLKPPEGDFSILSDN